MVKISAIILRPILKTLDFLTPLGDLAARLWVSYIFFSAGLVKISSMTATIMLFRYEYHVPLLPPEFAAYLGTGAELILPVLLAIGFGGRLMVLVFFVYNCVAVISYPYLMTATGWNGLQQHINWGLLLALLMFHGSGKLSVDYLIRKMYGHHLEKEKVSNE
jgi:putative oxidoreductase